MELTPIDNPPARPCPHPICLLIPSADEDELQDLTDNVRAHGLIDPIVLFEGMILDGRNRSAACERAGVEPRYAQFRGGREDALILAISHNLKRRHLTKQAIADALVAETQSVFKITEPKTASSRKLAQAAGRVVSHVMIAATRKVKEKGEPELQEAVKRGRIGVQDAAKVADLLPEQQKAIALSPKPRRAAAEAAEAEKITAVGGGEPRSVGDRHAALHKAWEGAKALRGLWQTADYRRDLVRIRRAWRDPARPIKRGGAQRLTGRGRRPRSGERGAVHQADAASLAAYAPTPSSLVLAASRAYPRNCSAFCVLLEARWGYVNETTCTVFCGRALNNTNSDQ
jgi:ParB-like chromosome segregation protein Spo0J